jgi:hypothetical protein
MSEIFVFGSNLAGRHGKGAALYARKNYGAIYGQGEGLQGCSYAIPTKEANLRTLSLDAITNHVCTFLEFALSHPHMGFLITPIGCGLAGYRQEQVWPMFDLPLPRNCVLHSDWEDRFCRASTEALPCGNNVDNVR